MLRYLADCLEQGRMTMQSGASECRFGDSEKKTSQEFEAGVDWDHARFDLVIDVRKPERVPGRITGDIENTIPLSDWNLPEGVLPENDAATVKRLLENPPAPNARLRRAIAAMPKPRRKRT